MRNICVFLNTTPPSKIFKILFRKFSLRHRSTLLCSNIVKFGRREIGEMVRYLLDKKTKFRLLLKLALKRGSRPKSARASPQHCIHLECSRFHPNRFTFGGAERVNTAKSPRKVNPIFGRSLASSRLKMKIYRGHSFPLPQCKYNL